MFRAVFIKALRHLTTTVGIASPKRASSIPFLQNLCKEDLFSFYLFIYFFHMMLLHQLEIKQMSREPGVCWQNCTHKASAVGTLLPAPAPASPDLAPKTSPAPQGRFGFLLFDLNF